MRDKVSVLHQIRTLRDERREEIKQLRETWEAENERKLLNLEASERDVENLEAEIKAARVEMFDGRDKSKLFGVGIRVKTTLHYNHPDAFKWAVEHQMALRLDTRAFEKIARVQTVDFVTVENTPQAIIAKDLGEYLEDDN